MGQPTLALGPNVHVKTEQDLAFICDVGGKVAPQSPCSFYCCVGSQGADRRDTLSCPHQKYSQSSAGVRVAMQGYWVVVKMWAHLPTPKLP